MKTNFVFRNVAMVMKWMRKAGEILHAGTIRNFQYSKKHRGVNIGRFQAKTSPQNLECYEKKSLNEVVVPQACSSNHSAVMWPIQISGQVAEITSWQCHRLADL